MTMDAVDIQVTPLNSRNIPVQECVSPENDKFKLAESILESKFPDGIQRVLLIAPPDAAADMFHFETGKKGRYWNYPPYGLGLLANFLQRDDVEVEILNLNHTILAAVLECETETEFDFNSIVTRALADVSGRFKPQFVGITCLFSQTHQSTMDTANLVKELMPDAALGLGLSLIHI